MNTVNIFQAIWFILKAGVAAYLGLYLVMFFLQARYIYFPTRAVLTTPAAIGLAYEDVSFSASDGPRIAAWFVPADSARGTVLICHGNSGNIGDRLYIINLFHQLGLNVLIFDYRGYGNSTGKPSELGTYRDALGAWNYLTKQRQLPPEQIIVLGRSLGGAIAAKLADQQQPSGLILEATFTSLPNLGATIYPYLPVKLLCRYRYPTIRHVRKIRCPILIAHSRADEMIPFAHAEALYAAAQEPKIFAELTGGHNQDTSCTPKDYIAVLDDFLTQQLGASAQSRLK